ncbi:MAG: hypothetical protein QNJ68_19940 [Microcoleaceae cyanobacterium MO_207.B10]|nr:hypothetical protein [Microcoleaceae cyanobacterium MO_207.B10]
MPSLQYLKKYLHWESLSDRNSVSKQGTIEYEFINFKLGTIYTLALFKDTKINAYNLADYIEFTAGEQTNFLSNFSISENIIKFKYQISAPPYYQWWAVYLGVVQSWKNIKSYLHLDWLYYHNYVKNKGTIEWEFTKFEPGAIYTLALFKNTEKNADDLAYYITGIADKPKQIQPIFRKHLVEGK